MVQSGSAYNSWFATGQPGSEAEKSEKSADSIDLGLTLAPADYQALLEELAEAQALDRKRVARIHQLEQALDQALTCLAELRAQLQDQQILETQLATTEEFSHVQQQAIARFKLQIAEQQQLLDAQVLETQQRDQAIQELMATIETMTQAQRQELERLRSYLVQDQVEVQNHRNLLEQQIQELQSALESRQQRVSELESETLAARTLTASLREQLATAQQQTRDLSLRLKQHQADWAQLETQLAEAQQERTHAASTKTQPMLPLPRPRSVTPESGAIVSALQQDLTRAHRRIETLENQLAQQVRQQAHWQQNQQYMEEERGRLQNRLVILEQQSAEMQEQILHQAQQATEYETAVQYWKDRHANSQRQISHLRELLEQAMAHAPSGSEEGNALPELLNALLLAIPSDPKDNASGVPLPRLTTPELPNFLIRRSNRVREAGLEP